jgi:hypothetical protein
MRDPVTLDCEALQAALGYAADGWHVFPCDPATKRPVTDNGLHDATADAHTIRKWWQQWPGAMIGVRTGAASGFFALDLDVDPDNGLDGEAAFAALAAGKDPPETVKTRTPRGGQHLLFRWVGRVRNSAGKIAPGVDVRGDGGYVIVPPSRRSDGKFYESLCAMSGGPAAAPQWLVRLVTEEEAPRHAPRDAKNGGRSGGNGAYGPMALKRECACVAGATVGTRNDTLNKAAFNLFQLVGGGELADAEVRARLAAAAEAAGLPADEANKTIASAAMAGMAQPRQRPAVSPAPMPTPARPSDARERTLATGPNVVWRIPRNGHRRTCHPLEQSWRRRTNSGTCPSSHPFILATWCFDGRPEPGQSSA